MLRLDPWLLQQGGQQVAVDVLRPEVAGPGFILRLSALRLVLRLLGPRGGRVLRVGQPLERFSLQGLAAQRLLRQGGPCLQGRVLLQQEAGHPGLPPAPAPARGRHLRQPRPQVRRHLLLRAERPLRRLVLRRLDPRRHLRRRARQGPADRLLVRRGGGRGERRGGRRAAGLLLLRCRCASLHAAPRTPRRLSPPLLPPPSPPHHSWGKLWGQDAFCDGTGGILGAAPPTIAGVTGSADADLSQQSDGSDVPLDPTDPAETPDDNSIPDAPPADEIPTDNTPTNPTGDDNSGDAPPPTDDTPTDGDKADSQSTDVPTDSKPTDSKPAEEPTKPTCPTISKCEAVDPDTCECTTCADGYEASPDGTACAKAQPPTPTCPTISKCEAVDPDTCECTACADGYEASPDGTKCAEAQPPKPTCTPIDSCKEQDADTCECVRCAGGFEPSADGASCDEQVDEPLASDTDSTDPTDSTSTDPTDETAQ